jgi:hypothetical protein
MEINQLIHAAGDVVLHVISTVSPGVGYTGMGTGKLP